MAFRMIHATPAAADETDAFTVYIFSAVERPVRIPYGSSERL